MNFSGNFKLRRGKNLLLSCTLADTKPNIEFAPGLISFIFQKAFDNLQRVCRRQDCPCWFDIVF